jgi:hypothetical protein
VSVYFRRHGNFHTSSHLANEIHVELLHLPGGGTIVHVPLQVAAQSYAWRSQYIVNNVKTETRGYSLLPKCILCVSWA